MPSPPWPRSGSVAPGEEVEHRRQRLGGDADSGVGHGDRGVTSLARHAQRDPAARGGELGGVVQDVGQHLDQPGLVAVDGQQLVGHVDGQHVPTCIDGRPRRLDRPGDDRPDQHRLALQRDDAAGDPRHVEQVVDQVDQVLDLTLDDVAGRRPLRFGQLLQAQQLHGGADRRQRIAQLVGQHRQELVLALGRFLEGAGRRLEGGRPLHDPRLELGVEALQRPRLAIEVGEHADLGPQDLGHHRHRHVVHRPALVAAQPVEVGEHHGGDEDDRRLLEPRVLADHRRQLVAVELRHAHVHQHDRDLGLEQVLQRLGGRARRDQRVAEIAEDRLVGQQLRRLIVDEQDVDAVDAGRRAHGCAPPRGAGQENAGNRCTAGEATNRFFIWSLTSGAATSAATTAAARC